MARNNRRLIVVADSGKTHLFTVEADDDSRSGAALVERAELANPDLRSLGRSVSGRPRTETNTNREAGPVHPMGAQRERHRLELERRYARDIAARAASLTTAWPAGVVLLVAEPRLLGLIREPVRKSLHPGIELQELAKDYAHLTLAELHNQLFASGVIQNPKR